MLASAVSWNSTYREPPDIRGFIPGGQSFILDRSTSNSKTQTVWDVHIREDTRIFFSSSQQPRTKILREMAMQGRVRSSQSPAKVIKVTGVWIRIHPVQQSYQPQLPLSSHFLGSPFHLKMLSQSTPVFASFPLRQRDTCLDTNSPSSTVVSAATTSILTFPGTTNPPQNVK